LALTGLVERTGAKTEVKEAILSFLTTYDVIVGNYGTGKSTLVEEVASETLGVIYIMILANPPSDLYSAID